LSLNILHHMATKTSVIVFSLIVLLIISNYDSYSTDASSIDAKNETAIAGTPPKVGGKPEDVVAVTASNSTKEEMDEKAEKSD